MNTHNKQKSIEALKKAIKICGTQSALAKECGVRQQSVYQWLQYGVPAHRILQIEKATGGKVSRHELDPFLYPY